MTSDQLFVSFLIILQYINNVVDSQAIDQFYNHSQVINGQHIQIVTQAELDLCNQYSQYFETSPKKCITFKVRADKDAHIALASATNKQDPFLEIVLGEWNNSRSVIRKNNVNLVQSNTQLIYNELLEFWISWFDDGRVLVGKTNSTIPFLNWTDPNPINIKYFGVAMCPTTDGTWIIEEPNCPPLRRKRKRVHSITTTTQRNLFRKHGLFGGDPPVQRSEKSNLGNIGIPAIITSVAVVVFLISVFIYFRLRN